MKKLLIHAGSPKTGSSFIQSIFRIKEKAFKDRGILYPGVEDLQYVRKSNVDINGQLLTRIFRLTQAKNYWDCRGDILKVIESLFNLGSDSVFISDESLIVVSPSIWEIIADVCAELKIDLEVFGYYRRPDKYYPSHWAQVVRKHGEKKSLIDFTTAEDLPIWRNLITMTENVPKSSLFSYDEEMHRENGGLLVTCAAILNMNVTDFLGSQEEVINASLSLNSLTAIRLINDEFGQEIGTRLNDLLTRSEVINKNIKPQLPESLCTLVNERHLKEVERCDLVYMNCKL
jgi:hypothetical protein